MWSTIEDKVRRGERLSSAEGVYLLTEAPLLELGTLAHEVRSRRNDPRLVTYVLDTNPNYTNVCTVDCHFCAFYRKPGANAPDAYTHDVEGVMRMMEAADKIGATTVLLQGGLHLRPLSVLPHQLRRGGAGRVRCLAQQQHSARLWHMQGLR